MNAIDTDVLAVYHIFHKDPRYEATKRFFEKIDNQTKAVTIFNLLELCGILATATMIEDSKTVFDKYLTADDIDIIFPDLADTDERNFWARLVSECFSKIKRGMRLGDATILWTLETNERIESFVTWNTKHFKGKTAIKILTPSEVL